MLMLGLLVVVAEQVRSRQDEALAGALATHGRAAMQLRFVALR